jgi:hypothetical protein
MNGIGKHREKLIADWGLANSGELPYKIDPLRIYTARMHILGSQR